MSGVSCVARKSSILNLCNIITPAIRLKTTENMKRLLKKHKVRRLRMSETNVARNASHSRSGLAHEFRGLLQRTERSRKKSNRIPCDHLERLTGSNPRSHRNK